MRETLTGTAATAAPAGGEGERLLLELGRALHSYGTAARRLEAAFAALMVVVALVAGLLVANALVPARKAL